MSAVRSYAGINTSDDDVKQRLQ
uniref:Uncharacterized protein n=1 Tax=Caenorhabditis japonica TaxID=281687 RepID=A0A2Q4TFP2_CAEJA